MKLISVAVRRPVALLMCVLTILVLGYVSLTSLPVALIPDMNLPALIIFTSYPNSSPSEVDSIVTQTLETALSNISGLDSMTSYSSEGRSTIVLMFDFGTDMDETRTSVRERCQTVSSYLPDDVGIPSVISASMDSMPASVIYVSGDNMEMLYNTVTSSFQPQLESINGVASVSVSGGLEQEILVQVIPEQLTRYNLTLQMISSTISAAKMNMPAGSTSYGDRDLILRGEFTFENLADIESLPITLPTGGTVTVGDVADVSLSGKERTSISRVDGKDTLMISVTSEQDANMLSVCREVRKLVKRSNAENSYKMTVFSDQGSFIEESISSVVQALLAGAVIAVLVLLLFLGSVRLSLIIATSIPLSVILTFVLMYFCKITLNVVSLSGLMIGVGMMVDNSIVVLESVYSYRQNGMSPFDAAIKGSSFVGGAILASTLTTVSVFLPIVFMKGFTSELFAQAGLTITFSLITSLLSALTIVPCLFNKLSPPPKTKESVFDRALSRVSDVYSRLLGWAISHRAKVIVIAVVYFIAGFAMIPAIGTELLASTDAGQLSVSVKAPNGTSLTAMDRTATVVEERLLTVSDIDQLSLSVSGSSASFSINLKDNRTSSTAENEQFIRDMLSDIPGVEISVEQVDTSSISMGSGNVSISVTGDDKLSLDYSVDMIEQVISGTPGVVHTSNSLSSGNPEARIDVDRERASFYGLTPYTVLASVHSQINGSTAAKMLYSGEELNIVVRYPKEDYDTLQKINNITLSTPTGAVVPLSEVAEIVLENGPVTITRDGGKEVVTVTGQIFGRDSGSVNRDVSAALAKLSLPQGVEFYSGGTNELMLEAFRSLLQAAILAVILVFMIMAAQFESIRFSFVVMLSLPLAFTGAVLGLFLTGSSLNITSYVGIIMLVGIVVNNAIVLIDCINQYRRDIGMDRDEAIKFAGRTRLRPILMTTITTVLALLPMLISRGTGADMMRPMAFVIMGGLTMATLLTLVIIPVLYICFDKKSDKPRRRKKENEVLTSGTEAAALFLPVDEPDEDTGVSSDQPAEAE